MRMITRLLKWILPRKIADALHEMKRPERLAPVAARLGFPIRAASEDRRCLENVILPWFAARKEFRSVLFVGCDWYSLWYSRIFRGREYTTLDFDPAKRRYGARRHLVGPMQELRRWFAPGSLDLIVCNGVVGWGLDEKADIEKAFRSSFEALRPGGVLAVGWNDQPGFVPVPLENVEALQKFQPLVFEPLGSAQVRTRTVNNHVFNFYTRIMAVLTGLVSDAPLVMLEAI